MRFSPPRLKNSLTIVVLFLSALTLAAVGINWYGQQRTRADLDALIATGVSANTQVKNAYVDALLAVNQIDAAIKVDNPQQRGRELDAADKLLDSSRKRLQAFLEADNLSGTNGGITKQILRETFASYWAQARELRTLANVQDTQAYETLKRGQARNAARTIDSAFNKFDAYLEADNEALVGSIDGRFMQARLISGGLVVLALLLALLACLAVVRMVVRPLKRVGVHFDYIAAGDLTHRIDTSSQNEIGALYTALKRMQDSLGRIVGTVRQGMEEINTGSQRIAVGNTDLSARTEQQAAALQQTAASMEELASTVKQNADNARQANQLAVTASEVAQRGGDAVGEVVSTMEGISTSSRKISDIVGVIDSIAFQTNILALNAAVEAARAGEQGKGFAVVASEVRALAQRSAQAAKEIKALIEDSVKRVAEGSSQVERAGDTMREIVEAVTRVTDIMGEIFAATTEQSAGIEQINHAVTQMDLVTQQNAALVEEAATSAASLRKQVTHVTEAVAVFKIAEKPVIDVAAQSLPATATAMTPRAAAKSPAADQAQPQPSMLGLPATGGTSRSAGAQGPDKANAKPHNSAPLSAAKVPPSYVMRPAAAAAGAGAINQDEWVEF